MRIPALDLLDPPPLLPGEAPLAARPGKLWTPDGEPIDGPDGWTLVAQHKRRPGNSWCTELILEGPPAVVSTVYLGLDHGGNGHLARFWETMIIIGEDFQDYQWRYTSRAAAHAGHERVVAILAEFFQTVAVPVPHPAQGT